MPATGPESTVIATYVTPSLTVRKHPFVALGLAFLRLVSEPVRSAFSPDQMCDLLAGQGFRVVEDILPADAGARFSVARVQRGWAMPDEHVVVACNLGAVSLSHH